MFEVLIIKEDGSQETYDALTALQAESIFFKARMNSGTKYVEINEMVEDDLN